MPSLAVLRKTEWSEEFESLMRNRMIQGAFRYGRLRHPGKPQFDRVSSAISRLEKYRQDGNTECLVDVANMMLLEFVEGDHPDKHFASVDDGEHVDVEE